MNWKPAPIVGGAYKDDARPWTCQDTVNYLVVAAERPGGRSPVMLRGVPGWGSAFCDTGTGKPIRGARDVEGLLLVVSGNSLFKVSAKGLVTRLGTIPGVGRVSMSHNQVAGGNQVAIANGLSGYVFDTRDSSLVQITDDAFPGAISFDFIDGYITGIDPARRFAFHSNLAAATDYNALDRYEAEGSPDKLVGQVVDHREWWLFSERTIEPFVNTGATTNTFQRASNTMIEVGCASGASIAQMDSSVFWVGNDDIVYRVNGYTPTRISTHAVEQALADCNLSQCFALTFEDGGHKVYYVTCPDGQTWGYDASSGEWHRRQSEGLSRWRANTLTRWNGHWIAGDYTNGKLYLLDWDIQQEDEAVLERRRVTGVLHDNQNRVTVNGFQVVIDTGQPSKSAANGGEVAIFGHLPDAAVGDSIEYQYTIGATFRPVTASISAGSLPAGTTLSADGRVTGTTTVDGSYAWTVEVMDVLGNVAILADNCTIYAAGIACGVSSSYAGGQAFPNEVLVTLGSATGNVTLKYATGPNPDRMEVWIDGIMVVDTGYHGSPAVINTATGNTFQTDLTAYLTSHGLPDAAIAQIPGDPSADANTQWNAGNYETVTFDKTTNAASAVVKIYSPLDTTIWKFSLSCPA